MSTPSTTPLLPHPPPAPVPMPIAIDCYPLMPVLRLPTPIGTTQNVLHPETFQPLLLVLPLFFNPHSL